MGWAPRLVLEQPNIENTIFVETYRLSSPEVFSVEDDDKFILYSGGSNFRLEIPQKKNSGSVLLHEEIKSICSESLTLFVLNRSFIIWLNGKNKGLELPYQYIVMSSLKSDVKAPELHLQVLPNEYIFDQVCDSSIEVVTIELVFRIDVNLPELKIPVLRNIPGSIESIYFALSNCSALHFDTEYSDQDDLNQSDVFDSEGCMDRSLEIPQKWLTGDSIKDKEIHLTNIGEGDDLFPDEGTIRTLIDPDESAAMDVDVGFSSTLGRRKPSAGPNLNGKKIRRLE